MQVRGSIRFLMSFDDWEEGWKQLEKVAKTIDGLELVGPVDSMGFE